MRRYWLLLLVLLLSLASRLGTLRQTQNSQGEWIYHHIETDERIYRALVEQVRENFFHYSLQGTTLLPHLPAKVYDFPYFLQHPPLFVYLSWLLETVLFLAYPLVVVLESLGAIFLVYKIADLIFRNSATAIWAALLLALCPLSWFLSQKYWIDSLLVFTVSLAFYSALRAAALGGNRRFFLAGLALASALLTKYTAVFVLPAILALPMALRRRPAGKEVLVYFAPSVLLVGAWMFLMLLLNGRLASEVINWDPMKYPYMAQVLGRPWYYYELFVPAFCPVYLLAFWRNPARSLPLEWVLGIWVLTFFAGFTLLGLLHYGYQSRLVAPAFPALALLAAPVLVRAQNLRQKAPLVMAMGLLIYGAANGVAYGMWKTTEKTDFDLNIVELLMRDSVLE